MNIILIPIGSAGDVHPLVGIGRELKRRGHSVTVFTNEYFGALTKSAGLEFAPSASAEDFKRSMEDPRLWHPVHGFEFVARHAYLPLLPIVYRFLEERYIPGQTLVAGSTMAWGARTAQEKLGIPLVALNLQPSIFMSLYETPVYSAMAWISRMPKTLKRGYFHLVDSITDRVVAPELNRFRASLGLPPVRRVLREWMHPPLRILGLFPEWFAAPQPDWPSQTQLTNFPLYDVDDIQTMPPDLEAFLNAGPPPVVFTAGSAMKQARAMFDVSAQACGRLGCRGVLVNNFPDQLPAALPPGIMAVSYAPFSQLFRRAAAVVHHGGIGTTAQALAAGVPQLVTPFAHDQFDNASRVIRLGVGEQVFPKSYTIAAVTAALRRLTNDKAVTARATDISARLKDSDAISRTCDLILEAVFDKATESP
ncbi:MAG: glycosyltransferase family 1 protein [Candidatus Hydrogenedentes bacterium]|nr:glycosyltransferase family 1 protein [Candidatus Hydrogenedentota bacterium]